MKPRSILVLDGHPASQSLSCSLATTYADEARASGHKVRVMHLSDMAFDPDFGAGNYQSFKPLEPDLQAFMSALEEAEHFVLVTPMWWGGMPAMLKALFDRAFLPGNAFDTRTTTRLGLPAPLLGGRTARVIMTADTPRLLQRLFYSRAIGKQISRQILGFVGIKPTRHSFFAPASHPKPGQVARWMKTVGALGQAAA